MWRFLRRDRLRLIREGWPVTDFPATFTGTTTTRLQYSIYNVLTVSTFILLFIRALKEEQQIVMYDLDLWNFYTNTLLTLLLQHCNFTSLWRSQLSMENSYLFSYVVVAIL